MVPRGGQNPNHPGFQGTAVQYSCQACIGWHAREYQFPTLGEENALAWEIYMTFQDQQRIGMDVIGLDYNVLPFAFDRIYQVPPEEQRLLFEKVVVINSCVLERRAKEREQEKQKREAKQQGRL